MKTSLKLVLSAIAIGLLSTAFIPQAGAAEINGNIDFGVGTVTYDTTSLATATQVSTWTNAHVTAATGIDAMVHAIEAYTSRHKKNPMSDQLARQALALLSANVRTVCRDGSNLEARSQMLLGSMLAGMAFANSPVAAVHALAVR